MRSLDLKLLRNLVSMKGQVIAIVLIIACGVASFVTVITAYRGLKASRDTYYARYRMADLFANVKRAPRSVLHDLEQIPGVRRVEGRIVFDVTIDLPHLSRPASGRVLSVPDRRQRILNDLHLTSGDWFTGDGTREVIVADGFAKAHDLAVGDSLRVLMNNKKEALAHRRDGAESRVRLPDPRGRGDPPRSGALHRPLVLGVLRRGDLRLRGRPERRRGDPGAGRPHAGRHRRLRPEARSLRVVRRVRSEGPGLAPLPVRRDQGARSVGDDDADASSSPSPRPSFTCS